MTRIRTAHAGLLAALLLPGVATAAGLNDTGITRCANLNENNLDCPQEPLFPLQDAETGRDAQTGLSKAGGGSVGFDFIKVCNSGELAGQGSCPAEPSPGSDLDDWGCTRDNVTGLIWEIKTDNDPPDLRDEDWTYTWYNSDPSTNGSTDPNTNDGAGSQGSSVTCNQTLDLCNTQAYVAAVNDLALCGYTDWRMPTVEELRGIVDYSIYSGPVPVIDAAYFPNTRPYYYWSASPYAYAPGASYAWLVRFVDGNNVAYIKDDYNGAVRLVRGGE